VPINTDFGRVDDDHNVFVNDEGAERKVGHQPELSLEDALAKYTKKFSELATEVRILEQRVKANADATSIAKAAKKLTGELADAAAVGDLSNLRKRVAALTSNIEELVTAKVEETKQAVADAIAKREEIAAKAEAIAAKAGEKVNFKAVSAELNALFEQWQALQKESVKVPKNVADQVWKRFSTARTKFESAKRGFFAAADQESKAIKAKKAQLVAEAEALVAKGAEAAADYRKLLDAWKNSGRSNSKADDTLWTKFKAAGDAIYALRGEALAAENETFEANLKVKLELIAEAEKIDVAKDLAAAKQAMLAISAKFEKAGKVPKDKIRATEDRIRAVESKIKAAEQELWRKTDPATIDRTNSVVNQLVDGIAKLESELEAAKKAGNAKKTEEIKAAIETKTAWLKVVQNS
jgi:hypothetical protein